MGRKTALALVSAVQGAIESFQAPQQSANAGPVPFAAQCGCYLARVQLPRDGLVGDKAHLPKIVNCWPECLSSQVRGPLPCKGIVSSTMFRRELTQARKHPPYRAAMPPTGAGTCYAPSVQLIRRSLRHASAVRLPASPSRLLKYSLLKGTLAASW
jgi:hypothetical protein